MFVVAFLASALASGPQMTPAEAKAEYWRLAEEMRSLAKRNAWSGVDRAYAALVRLDRPVEFADHVLAAQAATSLGDVTSARARLQAAHELQEDRQVIEWMWSIDSVYGTVELAVPAEAGHALRVDRVPFAADAAKSIKHADARLAKKGAYAGLLPAGEYRLGERAFRVKTWTRPVSVQVEASPTTSPRSRKTRRR